MADYTNVAQQRVLKVLRALTGHDLFGLTISQLATMLDSDPAKIAKDLANLKMQGFVEQDGEDWRHGKATLEMYRLYAHNWKANLENTLEAALKVLKNG